MTGILNSVEGPRVKTVEDVLTLERTSAPALTSDAREQFLADYVLHEKDLEGLADVPVLEPVEEAEGRNNQI